MATYFVRKNGSDAYTTVQAQNAATAWLTIDKAANEVAAGDTVYVGAGVYRELVTMDTAGSSGNQISFIADVDGAGGTGDPGLVVISAWTDSSTWTRNACWDPNDGKAFITCRGFVMQGGQYGSVDDSSATDNNYEGVIFEDCVFTCDNDFTDSAALFNFNAGSSPTGDGLTIRRCVFVGAGIHIIFDDNETAERDLKVSIDSCLFVGGMNISSNDGAALSFDRSVTGTYHSGGVSFTNNTVFGFEYGVAVEHGASTTYPIDVRNSFIYVNNTAIYKWTSNDGALTSDYNILFGYSNTYANVTAGSNDSTDVAFMFGGLHDFPLYRFWGWSPYRPWENIRTNDDADLSALVGAANTADAPAFDLYNESRPMYGTVDDVGAVEGRARPELETTTKRTGDSAIRFEGAGWLDLVLPVADSLTTVDVYAQYDASYTGTLPQLKAMNIPGVADQTDTQTGGSGSWEKLTVTFTPTSKGVARIRLVSNDTSATGECFFDDLAVS